MQVKDYQQTRKFHKILKDRKGIVDYREMKPSGELRTKSV